jgi:predicted dienelactone hydrolase
MGGRHPLIILSHGYSNEPGMMSWLAENLASKGYVVAGVHHRDPAITNPKGFSGPLMNRPLDIAFTARELRRKAARAGNRIGDLIDPNRVAAIGYSMGGYGVLTAAGAGLSPKGAAGLTVPGGLMTPFLRGGSRAADMRIDGLKAVVAISPAGGGVMNAWGEEGLADIKAPLLIIAGDLDRTVGYADGPAAIFDHATGAHRYKLVFRNAGHSIGVNPAAEGMRHALWDVDWFEDPIWRKDRVIGVNLHFITAFLDRYVKGDEAMAGYLDGLTPLSDDGVWPASSGASWGEVSPGGAITLWKGFPRRHALGLELRRADPAAR